jgi:hypothetical protein
VARRGESAHGQHPSEPHPARHGLQVDPVMLESGDGEQYGRDDKERDDDEMGLRRVAFCARPA